MRALALLLLAAPAMGDEELPDPDDLWEAITTPERLARWMATYRGEFRLGGRWQALTRDGDVYCDGEVTECEKPRGFTTTWTVVGEQPSRLTVRLEPEGQKTNAHQTNRNLVLSDRAEAHSVPNLEILADDVRCGHGSAVGPLDEEQRYYLMSRGLDRSRSDRLQVKGFFEEALLRFPDRRHEPELRARMMQKYARVES